jgi:hypothetical protein
MRPSISFSDSLTGKLKFKINNLKQCNEYDIDFFIFMVDYESKVPNKYFTICYGSELQNSEGGPFSSDESVLVSSIFRDDEKSKYLSRSKEFTIEFTKVWEGIKEIFVYAVVNRYPFDLSKDFSLQNLSFQDFSLCSAELILNSRLSQSISLDNLKDSNGSGCVHQIAKFEKSENEWIFSKEPTQMDTLESLFYYHKINDYTTEFQLYKSKIERKYYYTNGEKSFGPFAINDIKSKINRDSLILAQGNTQWKPAIEIPQLTELFPIEIEKKKEIVTPVEIPKTSTPSNSEIDIQQSNQSISKNTQNKTSRSCLITLIIFFVLFIGLFYAYKNGNLNTILDQLKIFIENQFSKNRQEPNKEWPRLTESDLLNIYAIQNYKPNNSSQIIADSLYKLGENHYMNEQWSQAIQEFKSSLCYFPRKEVYFTLSKCYIQNLDFEKAMNYLNIAELLDFQPKLEIHKLKLKILVNQLNYGAIKELIKSNPAATETLMSEIKSDSLFTDFRYSAEYVSLSESALPLDANSNYSNIIQSLFQSFNDNSFYAENYFNDPSIYFNNEIVSPEQINEQWNTNNDNFKNPSFNILGIYQSNENPKILFCWVEFRCFRATQNKNQRSRIKYEISFNYNQLIYSFKEIEIQDSIFE